MFLKKVMKESTGDYLKRIKQVREILNEADAVIIGAGAGLSTAAGFTYAGERFQKYFADFAFKYDFDDMYSGGFYPYKTLEEYFAYWSRYIYINRYMNPPLNSVYEDLFELVKYKDYFVLTTNVDHCFQRAGFDRKRIFYTQGDYGLFQCSEPCHQETYDNEEVIRKMVLAQGYEISDGTDRRNIGELFLPNGVISEMSIPSELVPKCSKCGKPMTMNLRADDTFVQDEGWYKAAGRYELFERVHQNMKTVYFEIGVGFNTPGIIKYNFWQQVYKKMKSKYVCLNMANTDVPIEIKSRSICIEGDFFDIINFIV